MPLLQVKNVLSLQSPDTSEITVYKCSYCPKIFSLSGHRIRHETRNCIFNPLWIGQKEIKSYVCDICGVSYKHKRTLLEHRRNNCGRSHQCSYCGHIYSELNNLKKHLRSGSCAAREKSVTL